MAPQVVEDMMISSADASAMLEDAGPASLTGAEADRALAERVAFIETEIDPRQTYYSVGEAISITLRCFDEYGELVPAREPSSRRDPMTRPRSTMWCQTSRSLSRSGCRPT